ncbi:MAG: hypothetical protein ACRDTA_27065 [Pseudonocardiaceae bacterium]
MASVAGPAALLVAKAYKIRDRVEKPGKSRLNDKDAGDGAGSCAPDTDGQRVIGFHRLPPASTGFHRLPPASTGFHRLPPAPTAAPYHA